MPEKSSSRRRDVVRMMVFFLCGSIVLMIFSFIQKSVAGFNPFQLSGYIVPFLFGGLAGAFIGLFSIRRKQAGDELRRYKERLEELVVERTADLRKANEKLKFEIREREKIEEAFQEREALLNHSQKIASMGSFIWDLRNDALFWSQNMYAIHGLDEASFEGNLTEVSNQLIHPQDRERIRAEIEKMIEAGRVWSMEFRIVRPDDEERIMRSSGEFELDEAGNPARCYGVHQDITEHHRMQEKLRRVSKELLRTSRMALVGGWSVDLKTGEHEWSEVTREIHEVEPDFIPDFQSAISFYKEGETRRKITDAVTRCMETGEPYDVDLQIVTAKGNECWVRTMGTAEFQDGRCVRLYGTFQDITERKQIEEALRESEQTVRTLFEVAPVSILAVRDGKYILANPASARILGYDNPEKIVGLDALSTIAPEYHETILERMAHIDGKQENALIEIRILRPDGGLSWSLSTSVPIELEGKRAALIIGQDITQLKWTEGERERLMSAIEQVGEVIVITDPDGLIQYVNPAFEKVTKYRTEEVKGQNPRILKSGKQDGSFYQELWQIIKGGETWQGRFINKKKDGSFYTEDATISPVFDKQGKITNFVAVKRDITFEIELENRLAQSQKMEAIGTLAGGIAHDFNNILSAIIGFTEMVDADLPEGSRNKADLREVLKASDRAKDLVKQILTFSRQGEKELKVLRLDLIVDETLKMIRASIPTSIEIRQSIKSDVPTVLADPTQVHQVIMNLCTNAAQAMEDERGTVEVFLDEIRIERNRLMRQGNLKPGRYARLRLRDTGKGIPLEVQDQVFEPYFTTKKAGQGTGLGLSVVYGIVQECGGGIDLESEVGKGTAFTVYFPAAASEETEPVRVHQAPLPTGREHILFVDDEPPLTKLGEQYLGRLGYHVTTRQSAMDALELFKSSPQTFDMVVTDLTMPHMTGDELAKEILSIRPDIPIILCTGYSKRISDVKVKSIGISAFVMKPLTQHELASTVRQILDENQ